MKVKRKHLRSICVVGHSSEVKKEDLRNTLKSRGKISEIPVWLDTALN